MNLYSLSKYFSFFCLLVLIVFLIWWMYIHPPAPFLDNPCIFESEIVLFDACITYPTVIGYGYGDDLCLKQVLKYNLICKEVSSNGF